MGERFRIELDDQGDVMVIHPVWSLMGTGSTLQEATLDLMAEARELAEMLVDAAVTDLDHQGNRMRGFVLPFLTLRP